MATKKEFAKLDEALNSDFFKNIVGQAEDKLLERGYLTALIGVETQISLSITREDCELYANIDLQPEGELNLNKEQLDEIVDIVAYRAQSVLLMMNNDTFKDLDEISLWVNVTINGERP